MRTFILLAVAAWCGYEAFGGFEHPSHIEYPQLSLYGAGLASALAAFFGIRALLARDRHSG